MTLDEMPDLLTVEETSKVVRLGINQTYAACRSGAIPAVRFGRTWRIPKAALLALIGAEPPNGDTPGGWPEGVSDLSRGDQGAQDDGT